MEESTVKEEITELDEISMPPVEIVVVAHNPDSWFKEVLASFAVQNYPNLKVTILTTGPIEPVQTIASEYLPQVDILEVNPNHGMGRNLNSVLEKKEYPAYFLFCHHDVSLAPDAVRLMVEESFRSNAAIIGPKVVNWERPNELLDVGYEMDKLGYPVSRIEEGELDQEQYDAVSAVFVVSTTATLVRADLFAALGGFDEEMGMIGEDVDLCWRAHIAGARVMVVPLAIARHREEIGVYQKSRSKIQNSERHRLRAVLSNYGILHSFRVVPQAFLISLLQALGGLLTGNLSRLGVFFGAWGWNLIRPRSLLQRRKRIKELRQIPDSEIRSAQIRGVTPIKKLFAPLQYDGKSLGQNKGRFSYFLQEIRSGPSRVSLSFFVAASIVFLFGSRHLITRTIPIVGDLVPFDLGVKDTFALWFSNYWQTGIGYEGTHPNALGIIGILGILFWGCMGLLRLVLTLGMIPIGVLGVWFFLKPFTSAWIRTTGALIYFAAPVSYHSLASGSWDGLILFGCLPWALMFLARGSKSSPFGPVGGPAGSSAYESDIFREVLTFGFMLGVVFSFSPLVVAAVIASMVFLCAGSLIAGWPLGFNRMASVLIMSCIVAASLNLPWIIDYFLSDPSWSSIFHTRSATSESVDVLGALTLQMESGQNSIFGWGFPALAMVPLLLARGERWAWAVRGWALYLGGVAFVWIGGTNYLPIVLPRTEVLLVPSALGLAVASAMGIGALQRDLQTFRFGWRQLIPVTAIVASALVLLPTLGSSFSGDWGIPDDQLNDVLFSEEENDANNRILWIGDDDILAPVGQKISNNYTVAITSNLESTFIDRWQPPERPINKLLLETIDLALVNGTTNLGRLLAPFGITEIILVERASPLPSKGIVVEISESIKLALSRQLDLAKTEIAPGIDRYRNLSTFGFASLIESDSIVMDDFRTYASGTEQIYTSPLTPVGKTGKAYQAMSTSISEVFIAFPYSNNWKAELNGETIQPDIALDWGTRFSPQQAGLIELNYRTDGKHKLLMSLQSLLWLVSFFGLIRSLATARRVKQ
ncbi:MAG: hypothetical protein CL455_05305 [Acidimicrobiaceae bacterium]|nr:hypothetical protein [Acidimicrobiaceae bacterium]